MRRTTRPATSAAPARASTPNTAPSVTRSARPAASSTSAGLVNAQAAMRTAGPADATSSSPPCTRSRESANQKRDDRDPGDEAHARERQQERERRDVDEQPARDGERRDDAVGGQGRKAATDAGERIDEVGTVPCPMRARLLDTLT